jgi:hypothetical protein
LGLVVATSMNLAQTPTTGGINQGSTTSDMSTGLPLRPVDGTYTILAFERNGVPQSAVTSRVVTIRNNIMTINTGDVNQPAKSFLLRFLPNNHIRLIELDPRTTNTTGITTTSGPGGVGIVIGGAGTATTGTSNNGIPGTASGQSGTVQSPPFNPRPDLGGQPPAGTGAGTGTSVPGGVRSPPFNPRPDLGGTPPARGGAGLMPGGRVQSPPFNPRPDLGGTPPTGGTGGATGSGSGTVQSPPFNPRPDLGGTPPSTGTGANRGSTNPNQAGTNQDPAIVPAGVLAGSGTGAAAGTGAAVENNLPNHLGIEQGVYVLSSQFFAISVHGRISGPSDPGIPTPTPPPGPVTPPLGGRSTGGTAGANTTTGDPRGAVGSGTGATTGNPRGTVNPGTVTGDPRGTTNPGTGTTSGTGVTPGTPTGGTPVDNGIPGTGTTGTGSSVVDPNLNNQGIMPHSRTVLVLRRVG